MRRERATSSTTESLLALQGIDATDRKILSIVQDNGKATMLEIAKAVGNISKVAVSYRLKKLEAKGVIEGYYAKLNPEKLGMGYLIISRVVSKVKGEREMAISRKIANMPGVQSVYGIFGDHDLLFIARTSDKESAKALLDRVNGIPGVTLSNTIVAHTITIESLKVNIPK